jgi:hypothetical protein
MPETWTVTVTNANGRIVYAVDVDIDPIHKDSIDGPEAMALAYNGDNDA